MSVTAYSQAHRSESNFFLFLLTFSSRCWWRNLGNSILYVKPLKDHLVLRNRELPEKDLDKDLFPSSIFTPAGAHSRLAELLQVLGQTTGTSEEGPRWNPPPTLCCWEGTRFDPERRGCEYFPRVWRNKAGAGSKYTEGMNGVWQFSRTIPFRRSAVALAVPVLAVVEKARKAGLAREYGKISEIWLYWTNR